MRVLRIVSLFVFGALIGVPALATAATFQQSNTITIKAQIAPAHTVVVDDSDQIVDIFSNTPEPTDTIVVYKNEVDATKIISVTPALIIQYQLLVGNKSGIGILYDRTTLGQILPTAANQPLYLRLL